MIDQGTVLGFADFTAFGDELSRELDELDDVSCQRDDGHRVHDS